MDVLKRHLFLITVLVLLVVAAAMFLFGVRPLRSGNAELLEEIRENEKRVSDWAEDTGPKDKKKPAAIYNQNHVDAAKVYTGKVARQIGDARSLLLERQLTTEGGVLPGQPPKDAARFREWISRLYDKRCEEAASRGLKVDRSRPERIGDAPEGAIARDMMDLYVKRFIISKEVYRILADAKVVIPCLKWLGKGREAPGTQERGVQQLVRLAWCEDSARSRRRRPGRGGVKKLELPEPFIRHEFELEFIAHFSVVPEVVRGLFESDLFFEIDRVDVGRVAQGGRTGRYKDNRYQEAPVGVFVSGVAVEFDFSKDPSRTEEKTEK